MNSPIEFWEHQLHSLPTDFGSLRQQNSILAGFLVEVLHQTKDPIVRSLCLDAIAQLKQAGASAANWEAVLDELEIPDKTDRGMHENN